MTKRFAFQIVIAALVGGIGAVWLDNEALAAASSNLVSALSVLNAAIFPTVILSATVLKPANMSLSLVERYRVALQTQISFFFGMLLFSLFAIVAIMVAQTANWSVPFTVHLRGTELRLDGVYNFTILLFVTIVALRLPAFFRSLMSLVNVHIDSVASEVSIREQKASEALRREVEDMPPIPASSRHTQPFPTA